METPDDRARITRIRAENFRSIRSMDLELGDVTVLVGRNGAGKSNILASLHFLRDCVRRGFQRTLSDWEGQGPVRRDGSDSFSVGAEVRAGGWRLRYDVRFDGDGRRSETVQTRLDGEEEWVDFESFGAHVPGGSDQSLVYHAAEFATVIDALADAPSDQSTHGDAYIAAGWALRDAGFYDFEPARLKSPQKVRGYGVLSEDGGNLFAVLGEHLAEGGEERLAQALGAAVGGAVGFRVDALGSYLVGQVLYRGEGDGQPVSRDIGVESDGTVHMLAILGALYQDVRYRSALPLIAIEEPGRNLHPGALAVLAGLVNEASLRTQVLLTTHSPDLLDHFGTSAIRVVERVDGATVVGRMEGPQIQVIKEKLFTTGEIMRVQGLIRGEDG